MRKLNVTEKLVALPSGETLNLQVRTVSTADWRSSSSGLTIRTSVTLPSGLKTYSKVCLQASNMSTHSSSDLKPLCVKLGIPKGTTHAFRHGRISLMVASRLPDKFIQSQVGQVDKKITNHYTHFLDEENHEMVRQALLRGQTAICGQSVN
jgi:hypothetical protein